jgi:ADP-heptose:LPS heptosyltransferase
MSELRRNAEFVQALGLVVEPATARIPPGAARADGPRAAYFVVFPGASWDGRRWPVDRFAAVIRELRSITGWMPLLCGSSAERALCSNVAERAGMHAGANLAGQTSLHELAEVLRGASLLVSNETSAAHIAAAVGTPAIVVTGGGHYGRFLPYPREADGCKPLVASAPMPCFGCNWKCIYPREEKDPVPCIDRIPVGQVMKLIKASITASGCSILEVRKAEV